LVEAGSGKKEGNLKPDCLGKRQKRTRKMPHTGGGREHLLERNQTRGPYSVKGTSSCGQPLGIVA